MPKSTTLLLLVLASFAAWAEPDPETVRESVVQIAVMDAGEIDRLGSGFAVSADGHVLTAAHLVADEDLVFAVPLTTGAELAARVVYVDEHADLALLSVNGLELPPLTLASDGFEPGRLIFSAGIWDAAGEPIPVAEATDDVPLAVSEGAVGRHDDLTAEAGELAVPLIEHNAMIPSVGYGGPLLNECGEVAGINRGSPSVSAARLRRGQAPESVVHAVRVNAFAAVLEPRGVTVVESDTTCVSALTEAQVQAEEAEEELEQSRQELAEATEEAEETQAQLEQTQQAQEQAAARASEAEARAEALQEEYDEAVRTGAEEAEGLRTELDNARAEQEAARNAAGALETQVAALQEQLQQEAAADQRRLLVVAAAATGLVLVIGFAAFVVYRKRSRQLALAQDEVARARREAVSARAEAQAPAFPDCLLTGQSSEGQAVSVKIPGSLLGDGAILGRSPRNATLLMDDPTLSREHARLFHDGESLLIEDLDSTNGIHVNGRKLKPRTPAAIEPGDRIELGGVKVELAVAAD